MRRLCLGLHFVESCWRRCGGAKLGEFEQGLDAPIAGHPDREALSDPDVLALARAEHRAIVSSNLRDFRPLHNEAITPGGAGHFGMIFMPGSYRRTKADTGKIIASLETILTQYPGAADLADGEAWL